MGRTDKTHGNLTLHNARGLEETNRHKALLSTINSVTWQMHIIERKAALFTFGESWKVKVTQELMSIHIKWDLLSSEVVRFVS